MVACAACMRVCVSFQVFWVFILKFIHSIGHYFFSLQLDTCTLQIHYLVTSTCLVFCLFLYLSTFSEYNCPLGLMKLVIVIIPLNSNLAHFLRYFLNFNLYPFITNLFLLGEADKEKNEDD